MNVSIADAKKNLPKLIREIETGEIIIITRNGKPVAQLTPAPAEQAPVKLGTMRGKIHLKPGWDDPIDVEQFLTGRF